jgi:hypothetical protein|tara:strand:- start:63 stop:413 length:351 start_codon:yes stop_codon:yes gene_type:complete
MEEIEFYKGECEYCGSNSMACAEELATSWMVDCGIEICCLECGVIESRKVEQLTLEEVNKLRFSLDLNGIPKLPSGTALVKQFKRRKKKRKGKRSIRIPLNAHDKKVADRKKKNTL